MDASDNGQDGKMKPPMTLAKVRVRVSFMVRVSFRVRV
jgi:hypothetical protein